MDGSAQAGTGLGDIAFWLISQRILPPIAVVVPIYVLFQQIGLLDTQLALISRMSPRTCRSSCG